MSTATAPATLDDTTALSRIRDILDDDEWVTGDVLTEVAHVVSLTGRPHPGDMDEDDGPYPVPDVPATDPATAALDEIAATLGDEPDWSADTTSAVWASVATVI